MDKQNVPAESMESPRPPIDSCSRKRRLHRIRGIAALVLVTAAAVIWGIVSWIEYHHVDPDYTEAIQKIVDERPGEVIQLPTWMIEGYLPREVHIDNVVVEVIFECLHSDKPLISFSYYRRNSEIMTYDKNTDRLYILRKRGVEYTYTERKTGEIYVQNIYWIDGNANIRCDTNEMDEMIDENDLFHIATSVKTK